MRIGFKAQNTARRSGLAVRHNPRAPRFKPAHRSLHKAPTMSCLKARSARVLPLERVVPPMGQKRAARKNPQTALFTTTPNSPSVSAMIDLPRRRSPAGLRRIWTGPEPASWAVPRTAFRRVRECGPRHSKVQTESTAVANRACGACNTVPSRLHADERSNPYGRPSKRRAFTRARPCRRPAEAGHRF